MNAKQKTMTATFASIALVAVGALGYVVYDSWYSHPQAQFAAQTTQLDPQAFGSLAALIEPQGLGSAEQQRDIAKLTASTQVGFGGGGGLVAEDARMMIMPMYTFNYRYEGETFSIPTTSLPVYRRNPDGQTAEQWAQLIAGTQNPFFSLNPNSIRMENITLRGKNNDYVYHFDLQNGRGNINTIYSSFEDRGDGNVAPLSDAENIQIATRFLQQQGVSTDRYGEPVVDNRWKQYNNNNEWTPPVITVVFPEQAGNNTVYERDGNMPMGLTVSVVQKTKKVEGAWNILSGTQEASQYPLVNTADRVVRLAENGGNNYNWAPEGSEEITYTLGTPEVVYIQYYLPQPEGQFGEQELYVPALRFPVTGGDDAPEYYTPPQAISIPLVEQLVQELEKQPEEPPIRILEDVVDPAVMQQEQDSQQEEPTINPAESFMRKE